jgi:hypothetical protein
MSERCYAIRPPSPPDKNDGCLLNKGHIEPHVNRFGDEWPVIPPEDCDHNWVDAQNEKVQGDIWICTKCKWITCIKPEELLAPDRLALFSERRVAELERDLAKAQAAVEAARKYCDICQRTVGVGIGHTELWEAYRVMNSALRALEKKW